jgi:hypothetical protein
MKRKLKFTVDYAERGITMNEHDKLVVELLSLENEIEFKKENQLDTTKAIAKKKAINEKLKALKKKSEQS